MTPKIAIIGANGFLGRKLVKLFIPSAEVHAYDVDITHFPFKIPIIPLDITNSSDVKEKLTAISPDVTILTAAMTNVDACEEHETVAFQVNALGPKYVGQTVKSFNGRMIHLSTDFIFDGTTGDYHEDAPPNPLSVYGRTKLQGEKFLSELQIPIVICRTSVLYGWPDPGCRDNFFSWAFTALSQGKKLKIVDGQITTPTYVDDLAQCLFHLSQPDYSDLFQPSQILHTAGPTAVSRYEFVKQMVEVFDFSTDLLEKVTSFPQKAPRPPNSSLNTSKLTTLNVHSFHSLMEAFKVLQNEKEID